MCSNQWVRWDGQRIDGDAQGALPGVGEVLRTVRTPEFNGLVFHEVRARSVLNRVPASSSMPFRWTVNPYRGCSHGCTYCLDGDTPVLMADGRTRALSDVRVGDQIYGTRRAGRYRHYVTTRVLDHWATVKPAYRVTLADGTRLVSSGDHRFLTERGWKHVTGAVSGPARRPHLTTGNKLMGTGGFAAPPESGVDYRHGYVCGLLRSAPTGRGPSPAPDEDVAARAAGYLAEGGADTAWPCDPPDEWRKGFLAALFDLRGSHARRVLRLRHADAEVLGVVALALKRFGFGYVAEDAVPGGAGVLRLVGGLGEHLRFFHTVDPASTRKRTVAGMAVKSSAELDVVSVEPLGREQPLYDVTTGTGDFIANGVISHNCFARNTHTYLDLDSGRDFDTQVIVKVNAPEALRARLSSRSWAREHVAMGTNTDPYQRAEGRYELMPGIIGALASSGTPFSILTKGTVLARDIPLLAEAAKEVPVGIGVSIALVDRELQRSLEPGTPSPQARLELVRRIRAAGLPCGVFVAPVLPRLTDSVERLDQLLAAVADAGATGVTVLPLHLRPGAREWFAAWLRREHPELAGEYRSIYGRGSYADRRYRRTLAERVGPLLRRHGLAPTYGRANDGPDSTDGTGGTGMADWVTADRAADAHRPSEPDLPDGVGRAQDGERGGDDDRAVWPSGSLPAGAPERATVDPVQLTLL